MLSDYLILCLGWATICLALPAAQYRLNSFSSSTPRPLVIWHGLGDTSLSSGMAGIKADIEEMYPGIFVKNLQIPAGGNLDDERKAGFWGNASSQVDLIAQEINSTAELADGFDAIGFSQGGLFLRDYTQRFNNPPVHNLITFGSPHLGISTLIPCRTPYDLTCRVAQQAAKRGIYNQWAQGNLIQAAYFRDPDRLEEFWKVNSYLTKLNGELQDQPEARDGLVGLNRFVMVMFDKDETVYPKQSAHFGSFSPGDHDPLDMEDHDFLWKEDHIGLKRLNEKGGIFQVTCEGAHMDLEWGKEDGCARRLVKDFVGGKMG